jgi:hypothetical protein
MKASNLVIAPTTVVVEMTPQDAGLFLLFQEHYKEFAFLTAKGIWDIKRGSATLYFDPEGKLTSIKRELHDTC